MFRQSQKALSDRLSDLVSDLEGLLFEIHQVTLKHAEGLDVPMSQSHSRFETKSERLINGIETVLDSALNELARIEGDPFIVDDDEVTQSDYENPDEEEEAEFTPEEFEESEESEFDSQEDQ